MTSAGSVPGIDPMPVAQPAGQGNCGVAVVSGTLLSLVFCTVIAPGVTAVGPGCGQGTGAGLGERREVWLIVAEPSTVSPS